MVPFKSLHPVQIDRDYIERIWQPDSVHQAALHDWPGIQAWASEYALQADERSTSERSDIVEPLAINGLAALKPAARTE